MTTIKDVAREAKVAISTVSRVLNGSGYVSSETRARVLGAMQALQYQPNSVARSLKNKYTQSIGMALSDIGNPFFGEIARAIEIAARERSYASLFTSTGSDPAQEAVCIDLLLEKQVDGLIWFAPHNDDKLNEVVGGRKVPTVIITAQPEHRDFNAVYINDARGSYMAVAHLIGLGHTHIGYIAEPEKPRSSQERLRGYRRALEDHGIAVGDCLIVRGTFREGSAARAVEVFLQQRERPTAIFAANDLMAIEAIQRLRAEGLRIPEDIAVVGYDDVRMAGISGIDLTTVAQPKEEMGREAVRLLIDLIAGRQVIKQIYLNPQLVIRKSCGYHLTYLNKAARG